MIRTLVDSAFQTGYLSVASEGLIHQVLATKIYHSEDLAILTDLWEAVRTGKVKREASSHLTMDLPVKYEHD
ncbi:hypothetical protein [Calothrix rhizosoleniae]|uniref:hypothetical protein n=1 Tax=Calothrix rhizosoleniae TaxID=888997 RepID=UPI000B49D031|nr:hypothetical protein [Calothrix rhizosoleniae]